MEQSEATIRLLAFLSIFGAMAGLELISPRLERDELRGAWKSRRWFTNVALVVLSSIVLRIAFPAAAVGAAMWAQGVGWGLLPFLQVPPVLAGIIAFTVLDLAVWAEHVASHKIPLFWRFHRVHHVDTAIDVTTGLRFHPVEILLSMMWKAAVVVALGAPPVAVLVFEIVLNAGAMFSHSNIKLPGQLDRILRQVIVTPDMHRVHHSSIPDETDSNYGFNFAFWDRLFRTYIDQPKSGHEAMQIGLRAPRGTETVRIGWLLGFPFRRLSRQKKLIGK
jgi:sterol desaturase/sphingolipid hydroxylase (fatty acid hydroxylase superfamily)